MAAGLGGGMGGFQGYHIADAYVRLLWQDQQYYRGLAKARDALLKFSKSADRWLKHFNFAPAVRSVDQLRQKTDALGQSLRNAAHYARQVNASLNGVSRYASQMARAIGANEAARIRAEGAARAAIIRAQGSAEAQMVRALNAARRMGPTFGESLIAGTRRAGHGLYRALMNPLGMAAQGFGMLVSGILARGLRGLHSVGTGMLLGAGIGGVLTTGFAAQGIARESMNWETQLTTLRRITGMTAEQTALMSEQFKRMAALMPGVRLNDLLETAQIGSRMGIADRVLPMFASDIAKLSVALKGSDLPVQEATERIGSLVSVFSLGHEAALRFGSALVRLDQMSVASARDILDVANRMSGPAALFNLSPQKTLALATALKQARVPTETAGTAMGQLFMRMASTRDLPAFAKLSGMHPREFGATLKTDPLEAIKRLTEGLSKLDAIQASRALDRLHLDGQRVRGTLMQLARVWPLLDSYVAASKEEWEGMSTVLEGFKLQGETTESQLELMVNNLKLLAIELGHAALPMLKAFTAGIRNLSVDVAAFAKAHQADLEAMGQRVGRVFQYMGLLWRDFPLFIQYATLKGQEYLERFLNVVSSFGKELGRYLGDLVPQLLGNFRILLTNELGNTARSLPAWVQTAADVISPNAGSALRAAKALKPQALNPITAQFNMGAISGEPQTVAGAARMMGIVGGQIAVRGRLQAALAGQQAEHEGAVQALDDAAVRARMAQQMQRLPPIMGVGDPRDPRTRARDNARLRRILMAGMRRDASPFMKQKAMEALEREARFRGFGGGPGPRALGPGAQEAGFGQPRPGTAAHGAAMEIAEPIVGAVEEGNKVLGQILASLNKPGATAAVAKWS